MTTTTAPTITRKAEIKLNGFRAALTAHLLTVGKDQLLPVLTGVKITVSGDTLRMESTDRYRLTVTEQKLDEQGEEFTVLVFGPDVERLAKTLPKPHRGMSGGGVVFLSVDGDQLTVSTYDASATARLGDVVQWPRLGYILEGHTPAAVERIGTQPAYLAALAKMPRAKNEAVRLSFAGDKPVFSQWEHEDVAFTHVIMPARLA